MNDELERAWRARRESPFLAPEQAAFYLGISPRTLQHLRQKGGGPDFRRHTRCVRYHIDDLDRWSTSMGPGALVLVA